MGFCGDRAHLEFDKWTPHTFEPTRKKLSLCLFSHVTWMQFLMLPYITQILEEAKNRWLRPSEVCEIIRNYQRFHLKPDPPYKPSGGSLFLFDRKALRYFRKDGHRWRKKKDGKTVREAHEKLKSGSVDVLHCYYAHGEENENFQRRSYWMLDGQLEHIVLVHYREVNEGSKPDVPHLLSSDSGIQTHSWGIQATIVGQPSYASSPSTVAWSEHALSSELDDVDSGKDFSASPLVESITGSVFQITPISEHVTFDKSASICGSSSRPYTWRQTDIGLWNSFSANNTVAGNIVSSNRHETDYRTSQEIDFRNIRKRVDDCPLVAGCHTSTSHGIYSDSDDVKYGFNRSVQVLPDRYLQRFSDEDGRTLGYSVVQRNENTEYAACLPDERHAGDWANHANDDEDLCGKIAGQQEGFKRLDSFGSWMSKEIGEDCDVSLVGTDSRNCWNALDSQNDNKVTSSLSRQMQLDIGSLGPSLSQEQLFSILDFSPDWAYSGSETKVLIAGSFLGEVQHIDIKWCCMFGEVEVSAEVLTRNVLRCHAPSHPPGEFHSMLPKKMNGKGWREAVRLFRVTMLIPGTILIQKLLKTKLYEWLLKKSHEDGKGPNVLDEDGQGVIHLAAALGYEWGMKPIIAAGVSPSFRDAHGWTALHWAAYFGREETAVTLATLGSSPGALTDPTRKYPEGQTAADLASARGHKGISGYLAEVDLAGQLSLLVQKESVMDSVAAALAAEKAIETVGDDGTGTLDGYEGEKLSLRGSLAAVGNSAQAAGRIQAALRVRSFCQMQLGKNCGITDEEMLVSSLNGKSQKTTHFSDSLHMSAVKIQQKYRGWKGRREFLKIRNQIVKIQAHVRGHGVRRQYKKIVWSVGIVEKAILRWRRKGSGLRGFRGEEANGEGRHGDAEETDEYDFLHLGRKQKAAGVERALARVQSMARCPEARDQYMRMVARSQKSDEVFLRLFPYSSSPPPPPPRGGRRRTDRIRITEEDQQGEKDTPTSTNP
ncbi:unnamed protein product [Spirodela intermedia]|uniref:CG-1 domain-containing protein n=1 Tax=Spirodela intermedia TaxID=51605 RepID=A0A7I8IUP8_SPIIN|nr:unnamed protein product [Spirodela intermedia]CAA6661705.1 unnamed protein product [Spirodela intermedia]